MGDDLWRLALLPSLQVYSDGGSVSVLPRALDKDMPTSAVARLRDGTLPVSVSRRVFHRYEAKEGHELARTFKSPPVTDFGGQGHGRQRVDASEAAESLDPITVGRREGNLGDLLIQVVPAAELVVEEGQVLTKDRPVFRSQFLGVQKALEPTAVLATPETRLTEHESTPPEELQDVMTGTNNLSLEALPAPDQVPDPFFRRRRDVDGDQLSGPIQTCKMNGIATVMLPVLSRPYRCQRGCHHITGNPPSRELVVQYVTGTAGLVTTPHLSSAAPPLDEPSELTQIVGKLLDNFSLSRLPAKHGSHHGILVNIHPDPDHW
jgi:hypothetical protein